jgi:hypothetical protein
MQSWLKIVAAVVLALVSGAIAHAGGSISPPAPVPPPSSSGSQVWVLLGALIATVVAVLGGLKAWLELKKAKVELAKSTRPDSTA